MFDLPLVFLKNSILERNESAAFVQNSCRRNGCANKLKSVCSYLQMRLCCARSSRPRRKPRLVLEFGCAQSGKRNPGVPTQK